MEKKSKFIIFGGSFNPIHKGHISIISFILDKRLCDTLILIPTGNPPHKTIEEKEPQFRLKMINFILKHIPENNKIIIDDWECKNDRKKNYTIDTIDRWQDREPEGIFYLLIGADSLKELSTWKDWKGIIRKTRLLVCPRMKDDQDKSKLLEKIDVIKQDIPDLKFFNTICRPTRIRQSEMRTMPLENDVMVIIGSHTSANTQRLCQISSTLNSRTYCVESKKDLRASWFKGARSVGVASGASTPDATIQDVVNYLRALNK